MSARARLEAIRADGDRTLGDLRRVLAFITNARPEPGLSVLMVNSTIVSSVSAAEETIRQLFEEYLAVLESGIGSHSRLRDGLQKANISVSIADINRRLSANETADAVSRMDDLRRCLLGEPNYRLAKAGLADNQGNFKSKQFTDNAKKVGIDSIWSKVLNDQSIADYVGVDVGEECVGRFIQEWNEVFSERDTVVHRLSQASGWAVERVEKAIAMFVLVFGRLTDVLAEDADRLVAVEAQIVARIPAA